MVVLAHISSVQNRCEYRGPLQCPGAKVCVYDVCCVFLALDAPPPSPLPPTIPAPYALLNTSPQTRSSRAEQNNRGALNTLVFTNAAGLGSWPCCTRRPGPPRCGRRRTASCGSWTVRCTTPSSTPTPCSWPPRRGPWWHPSPCCLSSPRCPPPTPLPSLLDSFTGSACRYGKLGHGHGSARLWHRCDWQV